MSDGKKVIVVGGGASGLVASVVLARGGAEVLLLEKNDRVGKKLRITGKGRCNLTNQCDLQEMMRNIPTNPRFLYSALTRFSSADTMSFFENLGVPLKTERGRRVFPQSDQALDVVLALESECKKNRVKILSETVASLTVSDGKICGVKTAGKKEYSADFVLLATGGASYPLTGSTGDGYRMAKQIGHTVTEIQPSLVPLTAENPLCLSMQGLSLRNVALKITETGQKKPVYEDFGEMMFTHFGLTGPMILSASAHLSNVTEGKYTALIDLKPALDRETLNRRLLNDFSENCNKNFLNAFGGLLPSKMIEPFCRMTGISPQKKVNSVTKEEREKIIDLLKAFPVAILGKRPIREAIITRGGVSVREVNPATMESKLVNGLYFAGEILDVDAYTGGYNLQIAFATAVLSAESILERGHYDTDCH